MTNAHIARLRKELAKQPNDAQFRALLSFLLPAHHEDEALIFDYINTHSEHWPESLQNRWSCLEEIRYILQAKSMRNNWGAIVEYYYDWSEQYGLEETLPYLLSSLQCWRKRSLSNGKLKKAPFGVWQLVKAERSSENEDTPEEDLYPDRPSFLDALERDYGSMVGIHKWQTQEHLQPFFLELQSKKFREIQLSETSPASDLAVVMLEDSIDLVDSSALSDQVELPFSHYASLDYSPLMSQEDFLWISTKSKKYKDELYLNYNYHEYSNELELYDRIQYTPSSLVRTIYLFEDGHFTYHKQWYRPFLSF